MMAGILRTKGRDGGLEIIAPTEEEAKEVYSLLLPIDMQDELDDIWRFVRECWRTPTIADQWEHDD